MGKKREVREMQEKAMRENGLIVGNRSGLGASGEPGRTLKDQLIDGLCVCVEEPLTLPIHGHLDACPGIRAWLIVEAEFKRTTTAAPPAQGAPTPQAAQEWTPVPLGKLAEEWDRLENYYTQLADAAQGAGYDKGSFLREGKAIGISICAAQLRKALAQPGAPAKEER